MPLISGDEVVFPNNIINIMETRFNQLWPDTKTFQRPLAKEDNSETIGIYPSLWTPNLESMEISGVSPGEPTLSDYLIMVQCFIKDSDRERGAAKHSVMAKRLRNMLYRDTLLRLAFQGIAITDFGVTESLKKWGCHLQRYFSNEISAGTWVYLSTLEYYIETETT